MKLAMEAFAQDQQSDAVHVEVVAAPWTFTECNQNRGNNQKNNPDGE